MIEVRWSCYFRQGTRIYPGSAPLIRDKDLLPASLLLLLLIDLDYKDPTPDSGVGDFYFWCLGFLSLIKLIDLRPRTLLIKVVGSLDLQLVPSST